jgi:hypothetical protein
MEGIFKVQIGNLIFKRKTPETSNIDTSNLKE